MTGKRIGLVIGNNYPNSNKELKYSVADATKLKEILENKEICYFDNVVLLPNKSSRDAQIEIEKILRNASQGDLVFIYFSGHGKKDYTNDLCLLFDDTNEEAPLATSLTFDFINKCRKHPQVQKASIVIVLDCCYSAAAGIKDIDVTENLMNHCSKGMVILTSTGSTDIPIAMEYDKLGHSAFTYYIIEGLEKGYADKSNEGKISIFELYDYASKQTKENYSQSPKIIGEMEGVIPIGKNPKKIKENEFKQKKAKLVKIIRRELPASIYEISMTVLVKSIEKPVELTETDREIRDSLEHLLEGKISVPTYIITVQSYMENEETEHSDILTKFNDSKAEVSKIKVEADANVSVNYEGKTFTSYSMGMELVMIPAGKFMMGSPSYEQGRYSSESPAHEVTIKNSFYIGKYPVTIKQWKSIMGSNPSRTTGIVEKKMMEADPSYGKVDDRPVENVSWNDAQEFIRKINKREGTDKYRLPSEAEWEYACRAGTQTKYSFGEDGSNLGYYVWYVKNAHSITHPVGHKKPNPWGVYDMLGNVWEWCQDRWHGNYNGASSNGTAWEGGGDSDRVRRGGSWDSQAKDCRSAMRSRRDPSNRSNNIGFRVVREIEAYNQPAENTVSYKPSSKNNTVKPFLMESQYVNEFNEVIPEDITKKALELGCKSTKYVYKDGEYHGKYPAASIGGSKATRFSNTSSAEAHKINLGKEWVVFRSPSKSLGE